MLNSHQAILALLAMVAQQGQANWHDVKPDVHCNHWLDQKTEEAEGLLEDVEQLHGQANPQTDRCWLQENEEYGGFDWWFRFQADDGDHVYVKIYEYPRQFWMVPELECISTSQAAVFDKQCDLILSEDLLN